MLKKLSILLLLSTFIFANENTYSKEQIEKMIAKMVILGFRGESVSQSNTIHRNIKKYDLGGVILFDKDPTNKKRTKNIRSPYQLKKLTKQLQAINKSKLLISVDQEGGLVQRMRIENGFTFTPRASEVSKKGINFAKQTYKKLAISLNQNGINVDFAPVVDLAINSKNKVIVTRGRSFGKSSQEVVEYASIFVEELKKENVISVLKHFPGHGSSLSDSHKGFVDISNTWQQKELKPYKQFIKNNTVDMIMTAHVYNKFLDPKYPATLSNNINTKLLRNILGFKGVLISDDLQMRAISKHYSLEDTLTLAINSGVNMLLFANQLSRPVRLEKIIKIVSKQIKDNKIDLNKIIDSNKKINEMLNKY